MIFAAMLDEFKAFNTELVALSVDSIYVHIAWLRKIKELEYKGMKNVEVTFPLIEDIRMAAGSCGTAKERMENQDDDTYCLDWFMCFKREKK
ncbi:MAG: redoxin domain-containing protein [Desulfosporosinus sp.]|nr:redoxin domain-containing protein [Desulfosporosinus sp.]